MTDADTSETSEPPGSGRTAASVELADPQHHLAATPRAWLRDAVARSVLLLHCTGEVRIRIVGDEEMAAAHQEYLGEPGTTDVITFDMSDPDAAAHFSPEGTEMLSGLPGRDLDADLLICFDVAARQAEARDHAVEQELLLYVVHGLLHCLGHDDHDADAAARMHEAEDRVLTALGIGATYSRPAPSERDLS